MFPPAPRCLYQAQLLLAVPSTLAGTSASCRELAGSCAVRSIVVLRGALGRGGALGRPPSPVPPIRRWPKRQPSVQHPAAPSWSAWSAGRGEDASLVTAHCVHAFPPGRQPEEAPAPSSPPLAWPGACGTIHFRTPAAISSGCPGAFFRAVLVCRPAPPQGRHAGQDRSNPHAPSAACAESRSCALGAQVTGTRPAMDACKGVVVSDWAAWFLVGLNLRPPGARHSVNSASNCRRHSVCVCVSGQNNS